MNYAVTCLTDEGPDQERVRVTRKTFTREEAEHYIKGVAASREPKIESICIFCEVEYRTAVDPQLGFDDWPRCVNCGAC
jgi:hypothetical protein